MTEPTTKSTKMNTNESSDDTELEIGDPTMLNKSLTADDNNTPSSPSTSPHLTPIILDLRDIKKSYPTRRKNKVSSPHLAKSIKKKTKRHRCCSCKTNFRLNFHEKCIY